MIKRIRMMHPYKIAALFFLTVFPLMAQQSYSADRSTPHTPISTLEYEMAAGAYVKVAQINEQLHKSLGKAGTEKEKTDIQYQANKRMIEAVNGAGLSIRRYNLIISRVVEDDTLGAEFKDLINKQ